ncbi:MAG: hypothetical protein CMG88_03225 [Marinobacter sp.]|nr:hypothetical protein [Marinobacter sp.]
MDSSDSKLRIWARPSVAPKHRAKPFQTSAWPSGPSIQNRIDMISSASQGVMSVSLPTTLAPAVWAALFIS